MADDAGDDHMVARARHSGGASRRDAADALKIGGEGIRCQTDRAVGIVVNDHG